MTMDYVLLHSAGIESRFRWSSPLSIAMSAAPRAFASFLAALLVLLPLPGHWRARNIPTLSLIAWLFILNVVHGVNVIEWYDNTEIKLKVWCDISTYTFLRIIADMSHCFSRVASGDRL